MREIVLTKGMVCKVDDADYEQLSAHKWHASQHRDKYYASRNVLTEKGRRPVSMHRLLMPDAAYVDHVNGDTLDNQRHNLRASTNGQNIHNQKRKVPAASGYRGVYLYNQKGWQRWIAGVTVDGKRIHLGYFTSKEDAARAYDAEARVRYGEFAVLNFPEEP
jgi:hypothetical protein